MYCLRIWRLEVQDPGYWPGRFLFQGSVGESVPFHFLVLAINPWYSLVCRCTSPVFAFIFTWPSPCNCSFTWLFPSVSLSPHCKDSSCIGIETHPIPMWPHLLITSSMTLFPHKFMFWDTGVRTLTCISVEHSSTPNVPQWTYIAYWDSSPLPALIIKLNTRAHMHDNFSGLLC